MDEWEQPWAPTRREAERDAYEDYMYRTYEGRFQEFCWFHHLDPEDVGSAVEYEEWFRDEQERSTGYE